MLMVSCTLAALALCSLTSIAGGWYIETIGESDWGFMDEFVAAADQRGDSAKAAQAGIARERFFSLALRFAHERIGVEQAIKDLKAAIEIVHDVVAKGERGANQDDFVEGVLKQLAETTKSVDFDAGAKAVDDALEELDRHDGEQRQSSRKSREMLLEAGVEQGLLCRNPAGVAWGIEAIAALDAADGNPVWSQKYRDRFDTFYVQWRDQGVFISLEVAVEMARRMAASARNGDERGKALKVLGSLLESLGENGRPAAWTEAVTVYREALQEYTRERVPLEWAGIQLKLGNALTKRSMWPPPCPAPQLEEAVTAYREALQEYTRERVPIEWGRTQMNLGNALTELNRCERGTREGPGTTRLEEAVTAYREASQELTRERVPLEWARTQMNLGNALAKFSDQHGMTGRLEETVTAYREALREYTRERVPLEWATIQMSLGDKLMRLGELGSGTARLEEAVTAYRDAMKERTHDRARPLDREASGAAERKYSEHGSFEEAVTAYREAVKERRDEGKLLDWDHSQGKLGVALARLGERESGTARLEEAVAAYRQALQENIRVRPAFERASTIVALGDTLLTLGNRESSTARLEEAVTAYQEALQEISRAHAPFLYAPTQERLARAHRTLFDKDGEAHHLDDALEAIDGALQHYREERNPFNIEKAMRIREEILTAKGKL
jgi:tetratricopeptide (TPR) repeat protein